MKRFNHHIEVPRKKNPVGIVGRWEIPTYLDGLGPKDIKDFRVWKKKSQRAFLERADSLFKKGPSKEAALFYVKAGREKKAEKIATKIEKKGNVENQLSALEIYLELGFLKKAQKIVSDFEKKKFGEFKRETRVEIAYIYQKTTAKFSDEREIANKYFLKEAQHHEELFDKDEKDEDLYLARLYHEEARIGIGSGTTDGYKRCHLKTAEYLVNSKSEDYVSIAYFYASSLNLQKTDRYVSMIHKKDKEDYIVMELVAKSYEKLGNIKTAEKYYKKAANLLDSNNPDHLDAKARLLQKAGEENESRNLYLRAVEYFKEKEDFLSVAKIYEELGLFRGAILFFKKYIEKNKELAIDYEIYEKIFDLKLGISKEKEISSRKRKKKELSLN